MDDAIKENSTGAQNLTEDIDFFISNSTSLLSPVNKDYVLADILNVLEYVNSVMLPTFLVLGLVGNVLTIIIMQTRRYAHLTSRIILTCLAFSDSGLLLTQPFNKMFVMKLFGFDMRALSNVGCKMFFVIFKSSKMTSSWCVVLLCIERFVAVWYPLKAKDICSKRHTVIALIIIYMVNLTYNSVWSYASQVVNGFCFHDYYDVNNPAEVLLFGNFVIIGCTIYSLLPSVIMISLTPMIMYKLAKQRAMRKKITKRRVGTDKNKISAMLVGIVIAYLILVIPVTCLHIISFSIGVKAFGQNNNAFLIFRDICQILEQLNYAVNFFLYVVTSQQFRSGLFELLTCKTCTQNPMRKLSNFSGSSSSTKDNSSIRMRWPSKRQKDLYKEHSVDKLDCKCQENIIKEENEDNAVSVINTQ